VSLIVKYLILFNSFSSIGLCLVGKVTAPYIFLNIISDISTLAKASLENEMNASTILNSLRGSDLMATAWGF
jgi:hypothetical protein